MKNLFSTDREESRKHTSSREIFNCQLFNFFFLGCIAAKLAETSSPRAMLISRGGIIYTQTTTAVLVASNFLVGAQCEQREFSQS